MFDEISQPYILAFEKEVDIFNACVEECIADLINFESYNNNGLSNTHIDSDFKNCIANWRAPKKWLSHMSNLSQELSLTRWFNHLQEMKSFHVQWINAISNGFPITSSIPFNLINHKEFLLFSLKMVFAKKHNIDVVNISIDFEVDESSSVKSKHSSEEIRCNLTGFFLEGAAWDFVTNKGFIANVKPQTQSDFPVVCAKPVSIPSSDNEELQDDNGSRNAKKEDEENIYYCPLYATRVRGRNLLGHIKIPTAKSYKFWLFNGVAAISERITS